MNYVPQGIRRVEILPRPSIAGCVAALAWAAFFGVGAQAQVRVEAFAGEPWGVGEVTFHVGVEGPQIPYGDDRFGVSSPDGRVLYPVLRDAPVRRVLRQLLEIERPLTATLLFVFRGEGPLELQVASPHRTTVTVQPTVNRRAHRRLLDQWWEQTTRRWRHLLDDPEFPPVVENFVVASMARRLSRELPEPRVRLLQLSDERWAVLGELLGSEAARLGIDRALVEGTPDSAVAANRPLPSPMPWFDLEQPSPTGTAPTEPAPTEPAPTEPAPPGEPAPPPPEDNASPPTSPDGAQVMPLDHIEFDHIEIEAMAWHVPAECFYLRFGTFGNYLWFRDLTKKWEGDLQNMLLRRAVDRRASDRLQQQLSLRETALAKVLGPQVIEDVALVGLDPYLADGSAMGILFQAKNDVLLFRDLTSQRREALDKFPDATETTVDIAGREASLISTPDGQVRSYYLRDEQWHLVATSPQLLRRFLQAGQGIEPLAASVGFQHVRRRLPIDRDDALFAYLSPEFVRSLTSPHVWIEAQRRLRSLREMAVWQLAQRQAVAEGLPKATLADLKASRLLPDSFGRRHDGSQLELEPGGPRDSLRGVPGRFVPIADMETVDCSAEEASAYRRFADRFRQEIGQTPPLAVAAIRQTSADGRSELVAFDAVALPLEGLKFGKLADALGPPSNERMALAAEDLVHFEVVAESLLPLITGGQDLHHLFGALQDAPMPFPVVKGKLNLSQWRQHLRGYLGAWPRPGLLSVLTTGMPLESAEPFDNGRDVWAQRQEDVLLVSLRPEVIANTLPQLTRVAAERPAQAWIDVRSLNGTQLQPLASALGYQSSRDACRASLRLIDALQSQLHVPAEDCRELAERLVDGALTCPLGGEYELVQWDDGRAFWTSTALSAENRYVLTQTPADYQLPLLTWFYGLRGDLQLTDEELSVHLDLEMAKSAVP